MPKAGIGGIPIPPMGGGGGGAKPPMPGIGGAGKARGSNCAYMFCNRRHSNWLEDRLNHGIK